MTDIDDDNTAAKPILVETTCAKKPNFFVREDALDRVPGFKSWKVVFTIMLVTAIGLGIVGLITGAWKNVKLFPFDEYELRNRNNNKVYGTAWNWIHFMTYYLMALLFPDSWLLIFLFGVAWETMEYIGGWENWADIGFNAAGIALGVLTRKVIMPFTDKAIPVKCV